MEEAIENTASGLLFEFDERGCWRGTLSSSALATAVAVFALSLGGASRHEVPVQKGLAWLREHLNGDGGVGDTPDSPSNLATTLLAWSALSLDGMCEPSKALENWLIGHIGSLEPVALAAALDRQYGGDRSFSAPILSMAAIAGRLGSGQRAWTLVSQLPFELAALPRKFFSVMKLEVVSYALPALIAVGLSRHHHQPTRFMPLRWLRDAMARPSLRLLEKLQPSNGGFLEATPLTAFVAMNLRAAGLEDCPVERSCLDFLSSSMRPDGSWPIDTDLATWLTTRSAEALGHDRLGPARAKNIKSWLLAQQLHSPHPYTAAAPGGWGWSDLPGAVPDADDTAGALICLHQLSPELDPATLAAAGRGLEWLISLQNSDGGVPTFCRGWNRLPFDRSCPDITAHALRAARLWREHLPAKQQRRLETFIRKCINYLRTCQRADGAWIPLWFGHQKSPSRLNPVFGTAQVLIALADFKDLGDHPGLMSQRALQYLSKAQNHDGSWGGDRHVEGDIESTALAATALILHRQPPESFAPALNWLLDASAGGTLFRSTPIGLYFATLWYSEKLYPRIFLLRCLREARANMPATDSGHRQKP